MSDDDMDSSVRVAVRIRPQIPREVIDMCRVCTQATPDEPQVVLGADKAFTFDYVFDMPIQQPCIYERCVERLVDGALKGYNATVLAYGQTGSGKTFTMGTGFDAELVENQEGIIPRAVRHLFAGIEQLQSNPYDENGICMGAIQFSVAAQFMELYNEDVIDLLDPYNKTTLYKIHEDAAGGICVAGATVKPLNGPQDALRYLQQGALARTTASTQMNAQSSRSHALFTILIRRQRAMTAEECGLAEGDLETLTSKFHFVDLAGSERLKRTGATGERAREGISINCGLLALGNVISALGDKSKKATHIPYRDSKLTRLLQDSLGGNSQTLMIACISPSDRDFMETLNTLKYANRARNIKNRVQINQDQSSRTISSLRREIAALQLELLEYKQGKRSIDSEGNASITDTFHENSMLLADNKRMQQRLKAMQETINSLTDKNAMLLSEKAMANWNVNDSDKTVTDVIGGYVKEIEQLQARLIESEHLYQQLKKSMNSPRNPFNNRQNLGYPDGPENVINMAKRELEKDRELLMSKSLPGYVDDATNDNDNNDNNNNNNNNSDSDSDTESDDKAGEMQAELNDLSSDIELKTKLIEQLELSQQRMQIMRQHYEEKLNVLNSKIINTQKERDQVLANMGGGGGVIGTNTIGGANDKVKKVRDEYERKINEMQRQLRRLESAQKEHIRQQRELQSQEAQLKNLKNELFELKSAKIKLMRKMNDESSRHKEEETKKAREIAQLRKETRKQLNTIKSLQAQGAAKDQILKRRAEQVTALKNSNRSTLSAKAAGRIVNKKNILAFNARQARIKWDSIQRTIGRAARSKQAVIELERELERLLQERETLSKDLVVVKRRQKVQETSELASEEDTLTANLNYIQENIEQVQHSIMELEDGKEISNESHSLQNLLDGIRTVDEAKFLLEKLCNTSVIQTCDVALTQTRLDEREALLNEVQQDSSIQQQLLQHVLAQNPSSYSGGDGNPITNSFILSSGTQLPVNTQQSLTATTTNLLNNHTWNNSTNTLNSNGTYDIITDNNITNLLDNNLASRSSSSSRSPSPALHQQHQQQQYHQQQMQEHFDHNNIPKTPKVRRRQALPQEMLFGDNSFDKQNEMTRSYHPEDEHKSFIPLARVPSAPGSLKGLLPINRKQSINNPASPIFSRKHQQIESSNYTTSNVVPLSPKVTRRPFPNKPSPGLDDDQSFLPQSPPSNYRRNTSREDTGADVFSRLGAGIQDPAPGGTIREWSGKMRPGIPLHCTHVVEGHSNSVLSIKVIDNTLYTASADRTVRIWDLQMNSGPNNLLSHPGPVVAIDYDRRTNLLFSASGPFVKVWDTRVGDDKSVKTLCSNGIPLSGITNMGIGQTSENPITALCLGASGNLYTAASDKVRIWDLRMYSCLGKLTGRHQAAVMCVTAWEGPNNTDFVATGSKDHYVKVFEVTSNGGIVYPLLHLEPPHYDGVQALVVANDAMGADAELFSGSRDSGIKRWDLRNGELKQSLNNAHKGWVSGMAIAGDVLLSSCRGGNIRLWNVKTCDSLAEMKTDSAINDIVASGTRVFTASKLWARIFLWISFAVWLMKFFRTFICPRCYCCCCSSACPY